MISPNIDYQQWNINREKREINKTIRHKKTGLMGSPVNTTGNKIMAILTQTHATDLAPAKSSDPFAVLTDPQKMDALVRASGAFAKSQLIPKHFRGHAEDIFVVLQMAMRLQVDPMTMLQSTYVVHGRAGMSATLVMALAQRSGVFAGPITYTEAGSGETLAITAHGTIRETGEVVTETIPFSMAKAEGWTQNTKYQTMPAHMLRYRAATWLIRRYAPHVLLGMSTADELIDVAASEAKPTKAQSSTSGPNYNNPAPEFEGDPLNIDMADIYKKAAEALNWEETEIVDEVKKAIAAKHDGEIPSTVSTLSEPLAVIARDHLRSLFKAAKAKEDESNADESVADKRRKHINAKIGNLGLNREIVKKGLKQLFGIDSTAQCGALTDGEWQNVIDDLPGVAAAGKEVEKTAG